MTPLRPAAKSHGDFSAGEAGSLLLPRTYQPGPNLPARSCFCPSGQRPLPLTSKHPRPGIADTVDTELPDRTLPMISCLAQRLLSASGLEKMQSGRHPIRECAAAAQWGGTVPRGHENANFGWHPDNANYDRIRKRPAFRKKAEKADSFGEA